MPGGGGSTRARVTVPRALIAETIPVIFLGPVLGALADRMGRPLTLAGRSTAAAPAGFATLWREYAPRDFEQAGQFVGVRHLVVGMPALDQPHRDRNHQTEGGDGAEGRQADAGRIAVEPAQEQDAGLLVEVLHRDRATGTHQVVAAVLQQRVHRHHQEAAQRAEQDQERCCRPDVVDHVHQHHQQAHRDAQRHDARGLVQPHAHRGRHGTDGGADRDHADQAGGLGGAVAQRRSSPGQHDVAQVAADAPEQRGGRERDLAQAVAPEPAVAGPEIGQQRERVARHVTWRDTGQRDAGIEPGRRQIHKNQDANSGFRCGINAGGDEREIKRQQRTGDHRAHQLATQQHTQNDGGNRQAFNPAVGFDELGSRQQLGQDAVFGGRIGRSAQTHNRIRQQRVGAKQHHQAAHHLDGVAEEHHTAFGPGVGEGDEQRGVEGPRALGEALDEREDQHGHAEADEPDQ